MNEYNYVAIVIATMKRQLRRSVHRSVMLIITHYVQD